MRGNRPVSSHGSDQLISSPDNDVVRRLRRLAHRREPGLVLLEGPRVLAEAKAAGLEFELLVVREGDKLPFHSESRVTLTAGAYRAATQTVTPQGVMAIARLRESVAADAIRAARNARWPLLVLDGVQDPGNVGAICRTAAAAGAPALAVLPGSADPYGPKAVRASAGNVFRLVVARAIWKDLEGLDGFGATPSGGAPLAEASIESAGMIVLGSEAHGLSRKDLMLVTVPLTEGVESLNVAAAAALILFEIKRRRVA
ncbi:MAG: RNA methyltransferase [Chloroflexi bacterium]|nr:MAG: RNA methyltransferase [Chloroflexota bacterium]TMG10765.1 MAG: RNA methyltransferase [Chloroflexota bacterium]